MRSMCRGRESTTKCCGWNNVAFHTVRSLVLLLVSTSMSMSMSSMSSIQGEVSRREPQSCLAFAFAFSSSSSSSWRHVHAPLRAFGGGTSLLALPSQKHQRSGASLARRERLKARQSQTQSQSPPTTDDNDNTDDSDTTDTTKVAKRKRYSWMERYEQLNIYIAIHGSANVPTQHPELGTWVKAQRVHYNLLCKRNHPTKNPTTTTSSSSSDTTSSSSPSTTGLKGQQARNRTNPLTPEKIVLLNQVGFIWDKQQHSWDTNVAQLVEFRDRHRHLNVPQNYGALGRWVQTQRSEYTRYHRTLTNHKNQNNNDTNNNNSTAAAVQTTTTMTPERLKQLEDLNFVFHASEYNFNIMLNKLKCYKQEHGHIFVQHRDGSLGEWYYSRRKEYKRHILGSAEGDGTKSSPLTPRQIKALEDVGFSPSMLEPRPKRTHPKQKQQEEECISSSSSNIQPSWDIRWEELKEYREEFGNANVPRSSGGLGRWVGHQRYQKTLKDRGDSSSTPSSLTDDKEALLEELDFIWNVFDWQWDQKLLQLQTFQHTHGHTNVPQSSKKSDGGFGAWVQSQRNHYRLFQQQSKSNDNAVSTSSSLLSTYRITPERIAKLESIGFEWVVSKNKNNNKTTRKTMARSSLSPNDEGGDAGRNNLGRASNNGVRRRHLSSKGLVNAMNARDSNGAVAVSDSMGMQDENGRTMKDGLMVDENREWWDMLQDLTQWRDQYGNFDLLLSPTSDLGLWALRQRTRYRVWLRQNEENHPIDASQTFSDDRRQALTNAGLFDDICMW
eukprot:CAMPEP_0198304156 /NCGR_PEP_ID=MMETSP1449-20131203/57255_1 /TAXON_ID=420275 /ORGANISM="Attheya septentrionalis, Strain CCMP2084" /LENGTH=780 /DNA_ID=CAMNT_0044006671 /DNA_START=300 /DNA_END=2642 /DNA_ORIENTATION=+